MSGLAGPRLELRAGALSLADLRRIHGCGAFVSP